MYVQSKRTDEPPHDDQISSVYWFKRLTDRCDRVNNPQQSEGRPCRDEPRSQEADAGAFPQHEQVGGHQWAADEVRFFFSVLVLVLRWKGAESGSRRQLKCLMSCSVLFLQRGEPLRKWSGTRRRAQHHWAAAGLLWPRQHGVPAERRPPDGGECADEVQLFILTF